MSLSDIQKKQIDQANALFFEGPEKEGFVKDLYFGRFRTESMMPYPELPSNAQAAGDSMVAKTKNFCEQYIDAAQIDREAQIRDGVIKGLGNIGVLGMTIDKNYGGAGMSHFNYCRVMEIIGGHCGSTAVFVNAHHSIGLRALELFGTEDQKSKWMPPLAAGDKLAAFALTEPLAGSDAANVRTTAELTADGTGYVLNGEKRWITNGGIADVLTVMARTSDPAVPEGKITAFLVTPEMAGFEVVEERMEKVGIRGTATGRIRFNDMVVPKENILGEVGRGLKLALTVLDFGRTTFGACCTGAAKFCIERMVARANSRQQFGQTLGEFELVQGKIAEAAADMYAMESATYYTAALIDSGADDYMVETAMIKVFASDQLWRITNDCMQIWGGKGFFTDQPFERMMRDARLNLIGEGANDVLRCFIANVGFRHVGTELKGDRIKADKETKGNANQLMSVWLNRASVMGESLVNPKVPVKHEHLRYYSRKLSKQIAQFGRQMKLALAKYQEQILNQQYLQARLADIATELFMASCVYSRLTAILVNGTIPQTEKTVEFNTGRLYLSLAHQRNEQRLQELKLNVDEGKSQVAQEWLKRDFESNWVLKPTGDSMEQ